MQAREAYELALIIVDGLRPMCERIEVAGSIRRAREQVNDIDLVVEPKPGQRAQIEERILRRCSKVSGGEHSLIAEMPLVVGGWARKLGVPSVQLDVWFTKPDEPDLLEGKPGNWGTILLCRTGSAVHNIRLAARAKELGLHWNPYRGVMRGEEIIASRTEEEVFGALGLQWIPPACREMETSWDAYTKPEPARNSREPVRRVSDADAQRMFDRIKAVCAERGSELEHRVMVRRPA